MKENVYKRLIWSVLRVYANIAIDQASAVIPNWPLMLDSS